MHKLPIGISTLSEIINHGYVYVDKTAHIQRLVELGKYYFLSRPRRFGKSLLVDTLRELFAGNEALFRGLAIHPHWDWNNPNPVIYLSFNDGVHHSAEQLQERIRTQLHDNAARLQVSLPNTNDPALLLQRLIEYSVQQHGQPAVILVDEYDKPILDQLDNTALAIALREVLKDLYSVIKGRDSLLRFVLLTGVSKFSQVSLFSGLNNLEDITLDTRYATLCGYTQAELEQHFAPSLTHVDKNTMRAWYNGYCWLGESVYNPFDVLLFFSKGGQYRNYWFNSGTPSFLLKLLRSGEYYWPELEKLIVNETTLGSFELDHIPLEALLFQTGYLTIRDTFLLGERMGFELGYPNQEVRLSLNEQLLQYFVPARSQPAMVSANVYRLLETADLDKLRALFERFFSSIPYEWYTSNQLDQYEGFYASLFYSHMVACGARTTAEDSTNRGRIDLVCELANKIYIFEFKVISADEKGNALQQIQHKGYAEKYRDGRELYLVGIEFDKVKRNIGRFEWQRG